MSIKKTPEYEGAFFIQICLADGRLNVGPFRALNGSGFINQKKNGRKKYGNFKEFVCRQGAYLRGI